MVLGCRIYRKVVNCVIFSARLGVCLVGSSQRIMLDQPHDKRVKNRGVWLLSYC